MNASHLLIMSLVLNAFLVGFLGIQHNRHGRPHHGWPDVQAFQARLISHLPAVDGEIVRDAFAKNNAVLGTRMQNASATRARIRAALRAQPFVPDQLNEAFRAHRVAVTETMTAVQEVLVRAATDMTPAGREQMFSDRSEDNP
jgi:uncharacterized membrane protein